MANTIGGRLKDALERWHTEGARDKLTFQEAIRTRMEGRGGQSGVSYPTVLSYFEDGSIPSLEWLTEAANLLGVRTAWLALGEGGRTDEEERARIQATAAELNEEDDVNSLLNLPWADGLGIEARAAWVAALGDYIDAAESLGIYRFDSSQFVTLTSQLIAAPIDLWEQASGRQLRPDPKAFSLFAALMFNALSVGVRAMLPSSRKQLANLPDIPSYSKSPAPNIRSPRGKGKQK